MTAKQMCSHIKNQETVKKDIQFNNLLELICVERGNIDTKNYYFSEGATYDLGTLRRYCSERASLEYLFDNINEVSLKLTQLGYKVTVVQSEPVMFKSSSRYRTEEVYTGQRAWYGAKIYKYVNIDLDAGFKCRIDVTINACCGETNE